MFGRSIVFTKDEALCMVALVQSLDPDKYLSDSVRAVIYKAKQVKNGDTLSFDLSH